MQAREDPRTLFKLGGGFARQLHFATHHFLDCLFRPDFINQIASSFLSCPQLALSQLSTVPTTNADNHSTTLAPVKSWRPRVVVEFEIGKKSNRRPMGYFERAFTMKTIVPRSQERNPSKITPNPGSGHQNIVATANTNHVIPDTPV
jgi:hypothetical protein